MTRLALIRQLWDHSAWADDELIRALTGPQGAPEPAWREYAHTLGAAEVWLSRLQARERRVAVWPSLSPQECAALKTQLASEYAALLAQLSEEELDRPVSYETTDGRAFTNSVGEILTHAAMHGQYHRGKVNLLLRQEQMTPAPVDLIAFLRGAPTATEASATARGSTSMSSRD
jgi:uncharacterized damage-inducible protein DinB